MNPTLSPKDIETLARRLDEAQVNVRAIPKLTDEFPSMNVPDGYAVQSRLRRIRIERGERPIGWKAALTSKAKMAQMGIKVPAIGFLTAAMARCDGSAISTEELLHPRVECEVAFVMRHKVSGRRCTREDVLQAADFVLAAFEVIDSRFDGFKFDLPSAVADNASAARYVTGGVACDPREFDLGNLGVVFEKNGEIVSTAASAAVLGHPADGVAMLVRVLAELDEELSEGSVVLSGGISEAIPVTAGDHVGARFQHLGAVAARFV